MCCLATFVLMCALNCWHRPEYEGRETSGKCFMFSSHTSRFDHDMTNVIVIVTGSVMSESVCWHQKAWQVEIVASQPCLGSASQVVASLAVELQKWPRTASRANCQQMYWPSFLMSPSSLPGLPAALYVMLILNHISKGFFDLLHCVVNSFPEPFQVLGESDGRRQSRCLLDQVVSR